MTRSERLAQRLRTLRSLGMVAGASERVVHGGSSYRTRHDIAEVGFRYEMPDVHAAAGLGQLVVLDEENARRSQIAADYATGLAGVGGLELPERRGDRCSANHFFHVLVERRDDLAAALDSRGIDVGVHYPLNPLLDVADGALRSAEWFAARTLTLPLHPHLASDEVTRVVEAVRAGW